MRSGAGRTPPPAQDENLLCMGLFCDFFSGGLGVVAHALRPTFVRYLMVRRREAPSRTMARGDTRELGHPSRPCFAGHLRMRSWEWSAALAGARALPIPGVRH